MGIVHGTWSEQPDSEYDEPYTLLTLASCPHCGRGMLLGQWQYDGDDDLGDPSRVWPRDENGPVSIKIPQALRQDMEEARLCFRVKAYTASAVMVRRTLEGVCADQGISRGKSLFAALKELRTQGKIEGRLLDWAEDLRVLGNEGAHHTGRSMKREDVADALALAEAILDYLYVLTAQYEDFKRRRGHESKPG